MEAEGGERRGKGKVKTWGTGRKGGIDSLISSAAGRTKVRKTRRKKGANGYTVLHPALSAMSD